MTPRYGEREGGQATVELALCLPFVVLIVALIVETGLLMGDRAKVWQAAREAARVAAVDDDPERIRVAAESVGLVPLEVTTDTLPAVRRQGEPVTVTVEHRPRPRLPLAGSVFSGVVLRAEATMRIEEP